MDSREQANADAEEVYKRVQHHLESIGRQPVKFHLWPIRQS
jgi:hypothetical protein